MMDIVERLRAYEWREVGDIGGIPLNRRFLCNPDGPEAADEIKRLREALKRIAEDQDGIDPWQIAENALKEIE